MVLFDLICLLSLFPTDTLSKEIEQSDWSPNPITNTPHRTISYIKPLTAAMGPKSCRCELREERKHQDFDAYASHLTVTRTPDVPAGANFSVLTRTCLMWGPKGTARLVVTTTVEWSKVNRFLKCTLLPFSPLFSLSLFLSHTHWLMGFDCLAIIESSALTGQRAYHTDLDRALRAHLQQHRAEYEPEGGVPSEPGAVSDDPPSLPTTTPATHTTTTKPSEPSLTSPVTRSKKKPLSHPLEGMSLGMWAGGMLVGILLIWNIFTLLRSPKSRDQIMRHEDEAHHQTVGGTEHEGQVVASAVRAAMEEWSGWGGIGWKEAELEAIEVVLDRVEGRLLGLRKALERAKAVQSSSTSRMTTTKTSEDDDEGDGRESDLVLD